jgi:serine/threonine protein kinase
VASHGDLEEFLAECSGEIDKTAIQTPGVAAMKHVIRQGFGCLASGLAFMHRKRIRHKDVKPQNILVHQGKFIYTDFGYSFDSNGLTRSTTEGMPDYLTRRYSAPEVLQHGERNSKSDVYSLGCVFLDMLSVLCPSLFVDKDEYFSNTMQQLHSQLQNVKMPKDLDVLVDIIAHMTAHESSSRLCSLHAAVRLLRTEICCQECMESPLYGWDQHVKHDNCLSSIPTPQKPVKECTNANIQDKPAYPWLAEWSEHWQSYLRINWSYQYKREVRERLDRTNGMSPVGMLR